MKYIGMPFIYLKNKFKIHGGSGEYYLLTIDPFKDRTGGWWPVKYWLFEDFEDFEI